jgi:hypothetical protein
MRGLSTKFKERPSLNIDGTFPAFLSKATIADNAIHAHQEGKKGKAMAAPSGGAPKHRVVHPAHVTNPPRQHQHWTPYLAQHQQWAPHPALRPPQQAAQRTLPPAPPVRLLRTPLIVGATPGIICFNCGHVGHYSRDFLALRKNNIA